MSLEMSLLRSLRKTMRNFSTSVDVNGTIDHETEMAYLVDFGEDGHAWIPKSQIREMECVSPHSPILRFTIPEWLAKEKGII